MSTYEVHEESEADRPAIIELHRTAFGEAEGGAIAELVQTMWADVTTQPMLSLVLRDAELIAGHVFFSRARVEGDTADTAASILAPLAVLPAHQRTGAGSLLVRTGLDRLRDSGVGLVFVLGHPSYYPRFGFRPAGELGLHTPHPIPPEHAEAWMAPELRPGLLGQVRGKVRCARSLEQPEYW